MIEPKNNIYTRRIINKILQGRKTYQVRTIQQLIFILELGILELQDELRKRGK